QLKQELEEIDVVSLERQFVAHKNNIENPHNVTASQIGAETPSGAQAKVDELAGKGRTTETVKGNADAINNLNEEFDSHRTEFLEHKAESAKKHITESGSNSNGRYIKFDDGTMICVGEIPAQALQFSEHATGLWRTDFINFAYPQNFVGEYPALSISS